jgi:exonuclease SbcD
LLKEHKVHIFTGYPKDGSNLVELNKDGIKLEVNNLPYFRAIDIIKSIDIKDKSSLEAQDLYQDIIKQMNHFKHEDSKKIIMSHHAFGSFTSSKSEHVLNFLGLESLPLKELQSSCDYLALGHIHKPQKMSKTHNTYYSGSPVALRFSETSKKYINLISITENLDIEKIEIPTFRKLKSIKGDLKSIYEQIESIDHSKLPTWIEIRANLEEYDSKIINQIYDKAKEHNCQILSLTPIFKNHNTNDQEIIDIGQKNIDDIFKDYYKLKYPQAKDIPDDILKEFNILMEQHHEN